MRPAGQLNNRQPITGDPVNSWSDNVEKVWKQANTGNLETATDLSKQTPDTKTESVRTWQ